MSKYVHQPGALIIAQSGGPTPVVNASLAGVIQNAKEQAHIGAIYGLVNSYQGALKKDLIDLRREPDETLRLLVETPAAALGSGRYKVTEADYERILALFQELNVRYFVNIGGNGSMVVTHRLAELAAAIAYPLQVMGVPKTIDNDLAGTDHTPGYGSAARFLALATRDTGRDLEAMVNFDDVLILETMGRNAGWLAAAAALGKESEADAPHLVYVPEIAFDETQFIEEVAAIHSRLRRVFVVVSEGVQNAQGQFIGQYHLTDPVGRVVPGLAPGVGIYLTDLVRQKLGFQARCLRPSLIGRSASACVSLADRREAWQVGFDAVNHLIAGRSGLMVNLERLSDQPYECRTGLIPLADVAAAGEKMMSRALMNEAGNMISAAFWDYALPLIDGPLPKLARLQNNRIL